MPGAAGARRRVLRTTCSKLVQALAHDGLALAATVTERLERRLTRAAERVRAGREKLGRRLAAADAAARAIVHSTR
ncbi:MAG TPA: hypothetical protein VE987_02800 [Polyangiaceae bacterium]|nr:hypothetical protein [Polyangiaceae bacterium]